LASAQGDQFGIPLSLTVTATLLNLSADHPGNKGGGPQALDYSRYYLVEEEPVGPNTA